jgi:nitrous oxide reductase accessory protein NosL
MSNYSIKVTNNSGAAQNIAVYQNYPNIEGYPLVWFAKNVNNSNNNTFSWKIDWELNWGTSNQTLVPGVMWNSGGTPQAVEPNSSGGNNMMDITYSNGDFESGAVYNNTDIPKGSMEVATDTSFTVSESEKMSVSVYMDDQPTFAMQGKPNGKYLFDTHPTYYICVTDNKTGVAVSGTFVTSPTEAQFSEGTTALEFELSDTLQFKQV